MEAGVSISEYTEKWRGILIQIIKSTTELKQLHSHSCRFHFCSASLFVKTDKRQRKHLKTDVRIHTPHA